MALVENGSQLISISADGAMMLSSVNVLVKGIPIGCPPTVYLPTVHLMRQSDLVALDDRITELKNQVGLLSVVTIVLFLLEVMLCVRYTVQYMWCANASRQR